MIEFQSVQIEGYKSYSEKTNFNFRNNGLWHILGKNGSGKTNLIEAIGWCLTGKTFKSLKADQVVNWKSPKKGVAVILSFKADGVQYRIERFRKHKTGKNDVRFFKAENRVETNDPQKEIYDILGLTWEELLASVIYLAEDFHSFIEQTPEERQRFLEHIFQLDRFDAAYNIAVEDRKNGKRNIASLEEKERSLTQIIERIDSEERQIRTQKENFEEQKLNKINMLQSELSNLQSFDLSAIKLAWEKHTNNCSILDQSKQRVRTIEGNIQTIQFKAQDDVNKYGNEINRLQSGINRLRSLDVQEQSEYNRRLVSIEAEQQRVITDIERNKSRAKDLLTKKAEYETAIVHLEQHGENCVTCGQVLPPGVSGARKAELQNTMQAITKSLQDIIPVLTALEKKKTDFQTTIANIQVPIARDAEIQVAQEQLQHLTENPPIMEKSLELEGFRQALADAQILVAKINTEVVNFKAPLTLNEIAVKEKQIITTQAALETAKVAINPYQDSYERNRKLAQEQAEIKTNNAKEMEKERINLLHIEHVAEIFKSRIKASVMGSIVPAFNHALSVGLQVLFPEISVSFNSALELALELDGIAVDNSKSLSTGQRARINFAVCLAVYETLRSIRGVMFNAVFFDEVLDFGLDVNGQQTVFELLRNLGQAVYVVSHREPSSLADFDGTIQVQRENGVTKLIEAAA
jgi:DNA repair exonuclease SbcCD ATPase subunit